MTVLLFANDFLEYGKHLRQKIEKICDSGQLIECRDISQLKEHLLSRAVDVRVGIFCVQHEFDLDRLLLMQHLLESIFVILIIPNIDDDLVAKCHRLRPRFISYPDTQFEDVVAVMNHLKCLRKENNDQGNY